MVQWHRRSRRKYTGGKYHKDRKKRKSELGRHFGETRQGETNRKLIRTRGGNRKIRLFQDKFINVSTSSGTTRVEILDVIDNPANRNYARRKIMTAGAEVATSLGPAKITSRPGQTGVISGILIEKK
jgi:small subunit ribosomal protein S8e